MEKMRLPGGQRRQGQARFAPWLGSDRTLRRAEVKQQSFPRYYLWISGGNLMTKSDLIESINGSTGGTKKDTALGVQAIFDTLTGAIKTDGKFSYPGFGTFSLKNRAARQGRNPQTGETIQIAASKNVGFKASSNLKGML